MTNKTDQVIQALRRRGPSTCEELAEITGVGADAISAMFREFRRNGKYGLEIVGEIRFHGASGNARKVVAINETAYADYMAKRNARNAERVQRILDAMKSNEPQRDFPRPVTQFHTRWQPCSPYYQEAA